MDQRAPVYQPKRKPWAHQVTAATRLEGKMAFALKMAMRTGKTKTLLDDWGRLELAGEVQDLLVVAPAGVYRTWETAIAEHLPDELRARTAVFTWSAKTKAQEPLVQFLLDRSKNRILLVNVEALSRVERARALCEEFLDQRRNMMVVDESTSIKNWKAERTKFVVRKLRQLADYRRILTGLISPKSPLDLFTQYEFLDPNILGHRSFTSFRARYAIMKTLPNMNSRWPVQIVVGYRDVDELYQKTEPFSFRVRLEDCYDMPPKIYQTREVELTDEQKRIYRELKDNATAKLETGGHVSPKIVVTQILRLHQVLCGHSRDEDGNFSTIPENRTETLLDLLEEHEGKAIIWCSYDHDVRKVADAIAKRFGANDRQGIFKPAKVARFWGGNQNSREQEEAMFQHDPECRHIVATAAAGGRGRLWVMADLVVYYSNTADLEHRMQSEERAQGVDKVNSVLYVDLVTPGTVDVKMLNILKNKKQMSAVINGDNWREWFE